MKFKIKCKKCLEIHEVEINEITGVPLLCNECYNEIEGIENIIIDVEHQQIKISYKKITNKELTKIQHFNQKQFIIEMLKVYNKFEVIWELINE